MADPIVFERVIDATVDEAFALFTEPERLRRWQAVSASVDLKVGGDYRLTVVPGSIACGTFAEIDPGKRLVYTWGWQGTDHDPAPGGSSISVEFEPVGDQTKVTLTHSGLDDEGATNHSVGWTHFCDRLVVAAEAGCRSQPVGSRRRRVRSAHRCRSDLGDLSRIPDAFRSR